MFPEPGFVDTNGIRMAFYEQGEGRPVVLLHGFPELAYSWRYQLPALAGAGFRAIAPDQRGYGQTDVPEGVESYAIDELIADIHGLLDALELESAVFAGHDWGALVLWHMAQVAPERIDGLIQLNIPYFPRLAVDPIGVFRDRFGDDFYIVNFQDSDEADRALAADTRRLFDLMMRRNQITREQYDALPDKYKVISLLRLIARDEASGDPLLSDDELEYFATAFDNTGFTGAINWYRNWTRNWQALEGIDPIVKMPTLFIGADDDIIIAPEHIEGMKPLVADLEIHMLESCGHWSQQEKPDEVNRLMLDWLGSRFA